MSAVPLPPEPPDTDDVPEYVASPFHTLCDMPLGAAVAAPLHLQRMSHQANSHTGEKFALSADLVITDGPFTGCTLKASVYSDGRVYFRGGNQ